MLWSKQPVHPKAHKDRSVSSVHCTLFLYHRGWAGASPLLNAQHKEFVCCFIIFIIDIHSQTNQTEIVHSLKTICFFGEVIHGPSSEQICVLAQGIASDATASTALEVYKWGMTVQGRIAMYIFEGPVPVCPLQQQPLMPCFSVLRNHTDWSAISEVTQNVSATCHAEDFNDVTCTPPKKKNEQSMNCYIHHSKQLSSNASLHSGNCPAGCLFSLQFWNMAAH